MAKPRPVERSRLQRAVAFSIEAITENWGTKIMAFLLALIVFVLTRDEVERRFTVPLRVIDDPDRVLLTKPPETVEVRLRGPWANVNRLGVDELGVATLDLREARPGPMALDPAAIVMPTGVVLDALDYEPVDLRFEDVVERRLPIHADVQGSVDPDLRLLRVRVEPERWLVRGPVSRLDEIDGLETEAVDIEGARADLSTSVNVEPPGPGLRFVGVRPGELPTVRVLAELEPLEDAGEIEVETGAALREAMPNLAELEILEHETVTIRGPRSALRELGVLREQATLREQAEFVAPVQPAIEVGTAPRRGAPLPVTVRFEWVEAVPAELRRQLTIDPPLVHLRVSAQGLESL